MNPQQYCLPTTTRISLSYCPPEPFLFYRRSRSPNSTWSRLVGLPRRREGYPAPLIFGNSTRTDIEPENASGVRDVLVGHMPKEVNSTIASVAHGKTDTNIVANLGDLEAIADSVTSPPTHEASS